MKRKTFLSWSSGKDSAWALHVLLQDPKIDVIGLFCTVNQAFNRVAMHGVRVELLEEQAKSIGIMLHIIKIPYPCSDKEYADIMTAFINTAKAQNIEYFAFGDLFLSSIRRYREERLKGSGITPIFPIWGIPTLSLARQMVSSGLKARISCLDPKYLSKEFAGREYNESFLNDLPKDVDPCGENGEFHSFAYAGPIFKRPIEIITGNTIVRDGFYFTDLLKNPGK